MLLMMTQDRLDSEKSIGFHRYIRLRHLWNSKLTSDFCWFGYLLTSLNWVWFFRLFVPPCEFFTLRLVPKWVIHSSATTRIKSLTPTGCKILVACYSCSHKRSVLLNVKDKTEFFFTEVHATQNWVAALPSDKWLPLASTIVFWGQNIHLLWELYHENKVHKR